MHPTNLKDSWLRSLGVLAVVCFVSACGGSGDSTPTPPPGTGTLALALAPDSISVTRGANGASTVNITRGGSFAGAVALSQTGAPAGVTVAFASPSLAAGITSTGATVSVANSVTPGNYPITISASGLDVTTATRSFTLNVPGGGNGATVNIGYCAADAPIWFAYQDGGGPWTRLTPGANNTYTVPLTSGRGAIATVDTVGTGFDLSLVYATDTEFSAYASGVNIGQCATKTVTGTFANVATTDIANVSLGFATTFSTGSRGFSLPNVAAGPQDLFASRAGANRRANKLILRRGLDIPANGVIPLLDFEAGESFVPATANVTVTGLNAADTAFVSTIFAGTRNSSFGFLSTRTNYRASDGAVPYEAVPAAQLNAGELTELYSSSFTPGARVSNRFVVAYFRTPADKTLAMGPELSVPTVSRVGVGGSPYARTRVQLAVQPEYNRLLNASFTQTSGTRSANLIVTASYNIAGAGWDVAIPDFTGVTGWLSTWGLQNGVSLDWSVTALGGVTYSFDPLVADGATGRSAVRSSAAPLP